MPSDKALARRKKFLDAKKEAGGYDNLRDQKEQRPVLVYFDDNGDIVGISRTPIEDKPEWNCYEFTPEETEVFRGHNTDLFRIKADPKDETIYRIELKPAEDTYVLSEHYSLYYIPIQKKVTGVNDIIVKVQDNKLKVNMHTKVRASYIDIDPYTATAKGNKSLRFYLTCKGDPHFLLQTIEIPLSTLLIEKAAEVQLEDADYDEYDIYTVKLFDKYARTNA